ncbi:MAG: metallophosphoesterase [Bacteroidales bacterium]|nr:metallophosphoesterase [Bacteroidales bacterium]
MKNKISVLIFISIAIIIVGYFITSFVYPKNAGRYPVFIAILLLDVYLWVSIKNIISNLFSGETHGRASLHGNGRASLHGNDRASLLKYLIIIIYWLPLTVIVLFMGISIFLPITTWNPAFRTYLFGIVFTIAVAKLFPIFFLIIDDIIRLFKILFSSVKKKKLKLKRIRILQILGISSGIIVFVFLLLGMFLWVYDFKTKTEIIYLEDLPVEFNDLKIVQISDLHLGSWAIKEPLQEAVDLINEQNPDLVFFTGDLVNFTSDEAFRFENILRNVKSKYGVFSILGNHDYGNYSHWSSKEAKQENMKQIFQFYKDINWKLLLDTNYILEINNEKIAIIGVENWGAHARFPKYGDINQALRGVEDIPTKLLLSHDPSHWDLIISQKYPDVDITFSGHTHGFQFGIDFAGILWSPAEKLYKHWTGLYSNKSKQYLYVNPGIGTIGYPGRIGILPEISVIILKKEERK